MTPNTLSEALLTELSALVPGTSADALAALLQNDPTRLQEIVTALTPPKPSLEELFPIAASLSTDKLNDFYYRLANEVARTANDRDPVFIPAPFMMKVTQDLLNEKPEGDSGEGDDIALDEASALEHLINKMFENEHPALEDILNALAVLPATEEYQIINKHHLLQRLMLPLEGIMEGNSTLSTALEDCWSENPNISVVACKTFYDACNLCSLTVEEAINFALQNHARVLPQHLWAHRQSMIRFFSKNSASEMAPHIDRILELTLGCPYPEVANKAIRNLTHFSTLHNTPALSTIIPALSVGKDDAWYVRVNKLNLLASLMPLLRGSTHDCSELIDQAMDCAIVSEHKAESEAAQRCVFAALENDRIKHHGIAYAAHIVTDMPAHYMVNKLLLVQGLLKRLSTDRSEETNDVYLFIQDELLPTALEIALNDDNYHPTSCDPDVTRSAIDSVVLGINMKQISFKDIRNRFENGVQAGPNPHLLIEAIIKGCAGCTTKNMAHLIDFSLDKALSSSTDANEVQSAISAVNTAIQKDLLSPEHLIGRLSLPSGWSPSLCGRLAAEDWKAWLLSRAPQPEKSSMRPLLSSSLNTALDSGLEGFGLNSKAMNTVTQAINVGLLDLDEVVGQVHETYVRSTDLVEKQHLQSVITTLLDKVPEAATEPKLTACVILGLNGSKENPKTVKLAQANFQKVMSAALRPAKGPKNGAKTGTELKAE